MRDLPPQLKLEFNPFEPSGAGPPLGTVLSIPGALKSGVQDMLDVHGAGEGVKVVVIVGEYGVGKTCLLQWLHNESLPRRRIKPFYFDNPGVQFYSLANTLLRTLGRKDFAKIIWEIAVPHLSLHGDTLFQLGYEEYLSTVRRGGENAVTNDLQKAIMKAGVTEDEEVGHCLARLVTSTKSKPYYEYRDFLPRDRGSMVPEGEEAPYFRAILKTISAGIGSDAIAFLVDEFEEVGLQKRLTRKAAHDYLATLKRLINLTQGDRADLWLFLSMTPEAYETTVHLEPALAERFSKQGKIDIEPLSQQDAIAIMKSRIGGARVAGSDGKGLFPFPDEPPFSPHIYSNPRRLVKTCCNAISEADGNTPVPFQDAYLSEIERKLYPLLNADGGSLR